MNKRNLSIKNKILVNVLVICIIMIGSLVLVAKGVKAVNADNPGAEIDLKSYLVKGKINIVDFYSEYCPPCVRIAPFLEELDKKADDKVVIKIDINQKGVKGIDWGSPVSKQFSLNSIPHFKIFDENGEKIAEGKKASSKLFEYFKEAGISVR